jgi:tRNA dimethylallyltransferase
MIVQSSRPVFVLAGPTAVGKTAVADELARRNGWAVLSADAMLVYQEMDIGTAKPTPDERAGLVYGGLDWATPAEHFSVGAYRDAALAFLRGLPPARPVLVVGGTGLYIKALLVGLDAMPAVDPAVREAVERLYAEGGLVAVQAACRAADPERYAALRDPANPRRVMRALELARMGVAPACVWAEQDRLRPIMVLTMAREALHERIEERVRAMYKGGLLAEVERLRGRWPVWSKTAQMAIGYREAVAVLEGELKEEEGMAVTMRRTRQYARRQATWFRHQLPAEEIPTAGAPVHVIVDRLEKAWSEHGFNTIAG